MMECMKDMKDGKCKNKKRGACHEDRWKGCRYQIEEIEAFAGMTSSHHSAELTDSAVWVVHPEQHVFYIVLAIEIEDEYQDGEVMGCRDGWRVTSIYEPEKRASYRSFRLQEVAIDIDGYFKEKEELKKHIVSVLGGIR